MSNDALNQDDYLTNRVTIFKSVTITELNEIDMEKYKILLDNHYDEFVDICDRLKDYSSKVDIKEDPIKVASCELIDDRLVFSLSHESGLKSTFDNE